MEKKNSKKLEEFCEREGEVNIVILSEFEFLETIGVGKILVFV